VQLSIIVVAWNIENFIEQALRSCVFAGRDDYEVIVVHNASTDRTGTLIARVAADHPSLFRVIENSENEGLGEARNIGLRAARGRHVMFLDGDDFYAPETADVIWPILDDSPDVIVFNHVRAFDDGTLQPNAHGYLLEYGDCSGLEARLQILKNFNVAWNKVYRAQFLRDHNLAFSRRLYEDIDWHFKVLVHADRYVAVPDVLIYYRQRSGSILRTQSDRHFDLIAQYEETHRFLREDAARFADYGLAAYGHARVLLFNLLLNEDRLPRPSRNKFLNETNALLERWRSDLKLSPAGILAKTEASNRLWLVIAAQKARRARGRLRQELKPDRPLGKTVAVVRSLGRRLAYGAFCLLPIKNNRVFLEAYWGRKMDCNPLAIARGLQSAGDWDLVWSLQKGSSAGPDGKGFRILRKGGLAALHAQATAKYLVNNANFATDLEKRKGQVFVQTKHGTPLKIMGIDQRKTNPNEMDWADLARRCHRWDYVISSNPHSSAAWRQSFPYGYKVLETGYPRNDMFFDASPTEVDRIRRALGVPEGRKVALYAPTFRTYPNGQPRPLVPATFDPDRIAQALGPEWVLLVRAHYFAPPKTQAARGSSQAIDVSAYPNSNEVALVSDLLITDYSSLMFDYACLRRPIVLYAYDYTAYLSSRGVYFDITAAPPGPIVTSQSGLVDCLSSKAFERPEHTARIQRFADSFAPWDDGHATERVLTEVFDVPPAPPASAAR
jgi:CDP-glycerol glycerophosphotransferase